MSVKWIKEDIIKLRTLREEGKTWEEIVPYFKGFTPNALRKAYYRYLNSEPKSAPKILIFDIETAPMEVYTWGMFDQNISLGMVKQHTTVLSWSAKWRGSDEIMYRDQRHKKDLRDDKEILKTIRSLLDEADIVITQNGKKFDAKKLNYRFIVNDINPPSEYKHIDTLVIAKKHFGFDSNKLAHLSDQLCKKYKKQDHSEFAGEKLWIECLKHNQEAFKAMERYNKYDVLSLEELYFDYFAKWDSSLDFDIYSDEVQFRCNCGSEKFTKHKKHAYTKTGKFEIFTCNHCGKQHKTKTNLLSLEKRKSLKK